MIATDSNPQWAMCDCGNGEQDGWHILTECSILTGDKQEQIKCLIPENPYHGTEFEESHLAASWLRVPNLLNLVTELMEDAVGFLRSEIVL